MASCAAGGKLASVLSSKLPSELPSGLPSSPRSAGGAEPAGGKGRAVEPPGASGPAWPVLLGINALVLLVLGGLAWQLDVAGPDPRPIDERLIGLDVLAATDAVEGALDRHRSPRAFVASAEAPMRSFLGLSGQAAGLVVHGIDIQPLPPEGASQPVLVGVNLLGDPLNLPIFLDATRGARALSAPERVEVRRGASDTPDGAQMSVMLRFWRPVTDAAWIDTEQIGAQLEQAAPGTSAAADVLGDAAELLAWRRFSAALPEREAEVTALHAELAATLPPRLWAIWRDGGALRWVAGESAAD